MHWTPPSSAPGPPLRGLGDVEMRFWVEFRASGGGFRLDKL